MKCLINYSLGLGQRLRYNSLSRHNNPQKVERECCHLTATNRSDSKSHKHRFGQCSHLNQDHTFSDTSRLHLNLLLNTNPVISTGKRKAVQSQTQKTVFTTVINVPYVPNESNIPNETLLACWNEDQQTVSFLPSRIANTIPKPPNPLIPCAEPATPRDVKILFPLAPDHLITLVQFNVLRAAMTNLRLLSALHTVPRECSEALRIVPVTDTIFEEPDHPVPLSLKPTLLQRTVVHDKWINIFPHPFLEGQLHPRCWNL